MRFQGLFDLPRGKTLCIVFIAQIEWVAKIGFLIGNDLERAALKEKRDDVVTRLTKYQSIDQERQYKKEDKETKKQL